MDDFTRVESTAKRIKEAMSKTGKKQIDIVRETGIDKGALNHYLKGSYEPKRETMHKLANALNVSEMWLYGYDCNMERKTNDIVEKVKNRMIADNDFCSIIETIYYLNKEQLESIGKILNTFSK